MLRIPVPPFDPKPSPSARAGLLLRLRTRWKRRRLDEELSRGVDPAKSPELSLRAAQLRSPAMRSQLADELLETLAEAYGPAPFTLKLQPHRPEIRDCADDFTALAERLQDERPVDIRGMAMTARLLTPGASPLDPDSGESLRRALRSARLALDETPPSERYLPTAAQLMSAWGLHASSAAGPRAR